MIVSETHHKQTQAKASCKGIVIDKTTMPALSALAKA
jgi:hypothetical protein